MWRRCWGCTPVLEGALGYLAPERPLCDGRYALISLCRRWGDTVLGLEGWEWGP